MSQDPIHQPIAHDSAVGHVTGSARYVDDEPLPANTLHLAPVLSTCAHGELGDRDYSGALAMPGVVAVYDVDRIPGRNDVSPVAGDDPLFADQRVEYAGQLIAVVAAHSRVAAQQAAQRVRIETRPLPAIVTLEQAMAQSSFIQAPYQMEAGQPDQALSDAPHRLSGTLDIGGQDHFYLEGQAALAMPNNEGDLRILSSTQHPSEVQHAVARVLGWAQHRVDVHVRRLGGGFGGKETQGNGVAAACALVASDLGCPVKWVLDRDDDMRMTGKRHDFKIQYQVGFDAAGRIHALDMTQHVRCGYSMDLSSAIADRAMFHADNAYHIENMRVRSLRYKTHTVSATAFRGFGGPQGMMGIERVIQAIAHELRLDPVDVRLRNLYPQAPPQRTHYGMAVQDAVTEPLINDLMEACDYRKRRAEIQAHNATQPTIRRGIALTPVKFGISFTTTHLNQAGALVHIYQDGSVQVNHGGIEMGQGLYTKISQLAASALGLELSSIRVTQTQTDKVPNTSATAASSGADMNGMAVVRACETLRDRLMSFVAQHWSCDLEQLSWERGQVRGPDQVWSFGELIQQAYLNRISLSAVGFYATPDIHWDREQAQGRPFYYFAYGAAVTEVSVDTLTGENRIDRVDILHDCGRSLNPAIDLGQIEGGYIQGLGWLTTEELVWSEQGTLMTHAPSTYKVPCARDTPAIFNAQLWAPGQNRELTVRRSKAVGEPPLMLAMSAFYALEDAIAQDTYPALNAPATAERLLNAL